MDVGPWSKNNDHACEDFEAGRNQKKKKRGKKDKCSF